MTAKQLLEKGKLAEAIDQQTAEVKSHPGDLASRTLLFELLAYAGAWDRAGRQLEAIGHLLANEPSAQVGVAVYRRLVDAEIQRAKLFSEGIRPRFVLEPPSDLTQHLEAIDLLRQGNPDAARARLDIAEQNRTTRPGTLGTREFSDFRDADDLLAPVLEVFAPAGYYWIPWEQIQFFDVLAPTSFRDLLWAPAKIALFDGQLGEIHVPALYPGSANHSEETIRLGRMTDWVETGAEIIRGAGLKTFLAGDNSLTLFELRELAFTPPLQGAAEVTA